MSLNPVTVVRIYLSEEEKSLQSVLNYLHDEAKVRGVTVFRGVSGYGQNREIHNSHLVDVSFNLPLVIEFFDGGNKTQDAIDHLHTMVKPEHIISWQANCY